VSSVNTPSSVIAAWGTASPASVTESRVSALHTQNPESQVQVSAAEFLLNARDLGETSPHAVLQIGSVTGTVEQRSTTGQVSVTATADLAAAGAVPAVTVWAAPQYDDDQDFEGVVKIQSMHVDVASTGSTTTSSTSVNWRVDGLRVWDPRVENADGSLGGYVGPWTIGFTSTCGGWVDTPSLCGPNRTDGKEPFENPNPVLIPPAYAGPGGGVSLSIVAGVTVRDAAADAAAGTSRASASQKNILAISTRDDIEGAVALEPMFVGLGDVDTSVSYVAHEH
jgi:hypothetical protein